MGALALPERGTILDALLTKPLSAQPPLLTLHTLARARRSSLCQLCPKGGRHRASQQALYDLRWHIFRRSVTKGPHAIKSAELTAAVLTKKVSNGLMCIEAFLIHSCAVIEIEVDVSDRGEATLRPALMIQYWGSKPAREWRFKHARELHRKHLAGIRDVVQLHQLHQPTHLKKSIWNHTNLVVNGSWNHPRCSLSNLLRKCSMKDPGLRRYMDTSDCSMR